MPISAEYVQTLLDFHYWARDRMLAAIAPLTAEEYARPLASSFPSVRDTAVHIYFAEWIWYARWTGVSPAAGPTPETLPDVASLRAAWREHERKMRALIAVLGDDGITRPVAYNTLSGVAQSSPFWEMFVHVVNHGTYHRGQVTTLLRQLGATPPQSTDMVAYFRSRGVAETPSRRGA